MSKYLENKELYINKNNMKPIKLVIQDNNQNTTIIIEYIEIELNWIKFYIYEYIDF